MILYDTLNTRNILEHDQITLFNVNNNKLGKSKVKN